MISGVYEKPILLPVIPEMFLCMLPQSFQQLSEGICPHHGLVNGDVWLSHVSESFIEARIQIPDGQEGFTYTY